MGGSVKTMWYIKLFKKIIIYYNKKKSDKNFNFLKLIYKSDIKREFGEILNNILNKMTPKNDVSHDDGSKKSELKKKGGRKPKKNDDQTNISDELVKPDGVSDETAKEF